MNGRQIEIFHTIMTSGTVTEAAKKLGITQPAVTSSLRQVEQMLGFNLFHRIGGRLHPTEEARILQREAQHIQDSLHLFKKLAERLKHDLTGNLRMASPAAMAHQLIPSTIADFMKGNPDALVDYSTLHHDQILQDVANPAGKLGLGLTFGSDDRLPLGSIPIGQAALVLIAPKELEFNSETGVTAQEIQKLPMVETFPSEPLGKAVQQFFDHAGGRPNYALRVHNHIVAANMVQRGLGAAIIDTLTVRYCLEREQDPGFRVWRIADIAPLPVTAVYSFDHPLSPFMQEFVNLCRRNFKKYSPALA